MLNFDLLEKYGLTHPGCTAPNSDASVFSSYLNKLFLQSTGLFPSNASESYHGSIINALKDFDLVNYAEESDSLFFKHRIASLYFRACRDFNGSSEFISGTWFFVSTYDLSIIRSFDKFIIKKDQNEIAINIVSTGELGLYLKEYKMPNPQIDIESNYGFSFANNHYNKIIDSLTNYSRGVYIFSGHYGTGKTYFIQHLVSKVKRKFIYLSETMISGGLDGPTMVSLLAEHPNSVLIIEDGERFIASRGGSEPSLVGSILNCADGILGNIINCSIIITHNQLQPDIDPALTRKGRLRYQYVFDKLSVTDAQNKFDKMRVQYKVTEPMSLADIYNYADSNNKIVTQPKKIGF